MRKKDLKEKIEKAMNLYGNGFAGLKGKLQHVFHIEGDFFNENPKDAAVTVLVTGKRILNEEIDRMIKKIERMRN